MAAERKEHAQLIIRWLREQFDVGESGSMAKADLYDMYSAFCNRENVDATTSPAFGKLVRKAWPTIKSNRKGPRGKAKHHYFGLHPRHVNVARRRQGPRSPKPIASSSSSEVLPVGHYEVLTSPSSTQSRAVSSGLVGGVDPRSTGQAPLSRLSPAEGGFWSPGGMCSSVPFSVTRASHTTPISSPSISHSPAPLTAPFVDYSRPAHLADGHFVKPVRTSAFSSRTNYPSSEVSSSQYPSSQHQYFRPQLSPADPRTNATHATNAVYNNYNYYDNNNSHAGTSYAPRQHRTVPVKQLQLSRSLGAASPCHFLLPSTEHLPQPTASWRRSPSPLDYPGASAAYSSESSSPYYGDESAHWPGPSSSQLALNESNLGRITPDLSRGSFSSLASLLEQPSPSPSPCPPPTTNPKDQEFQTVQGGSSFHYTTPFILWPDEHEPAKLKAKLDRWGGELRWYYEQLFAKVLGAPRTLAGIGPWIMEETHKFWFNAVRSNKFLFKNGREYLLEQVLSCEERLLTELAGRITTGSRDWIAIADKLTSAAVCFPTWLAVAEGLFAHQWFMEQRKEVIANFARSCLCRAQWYSESVGAARQSSGMQHPGRLPSPAVSGNAHSTQLLTP